MKPPMLQVALDNSSLEDALRCLRCGLDEVVDIIEVGTMLILMEGVRATRIVRTLYPEKTVVADFKAIAPHFASAILDQQPDFVTVLSAAEPEVIAAVTADVRNRGRGQQVQVELYGNWDFGSIKAWKDMGVNHVVYQRPRSRTSNWGVDDVRVLERLCQLGMTVTVAGGVSFDDLDALAGLPIFAVVCGRSVRDASDPAHEALRIKTKIGELWAGAADRQAHGDLS